MIPIRLTLEGLYSYQDRQTIDFTALTDAGLFGIFGAVGSGKSAILEAMTFGLYGETERMKNNEGRRYNMMNLRSNISFIGFEFLNHKEDKYKIERSFKRNSKNFEEVSTKSAVLYKWEQETWMPLPDLNVEEIVGLSYSNFKRTIIIPQGQFKEFLDLGATDRTKMLKDIFQLERFDLQWKTSELQKENKSVLDHLEGQLKGLEEISEEQVLLKKAQLEQEKTEVQAQEQSFKELEQQFQLLKSLKADFDTLALKKSNFGILQAKKPAMETLEGQLLRFERVHAAFAQLLKTQSQTQSELHQKSQQSTEEQNILVRLNAELERINNQLAILKPEYDLLPQKRIEETDLGFLAAIKKLEIEKEETIVKLLKGKEFVAAAKEEVAILKEKQVQLGLEIEKLKKSKPNATLLLEIAQWFGKQDNFTAQLAEVTKKHNGCSVELEGYLQALNKGGIQKENYETSFNQQILAAENEIEVLRKKDSHLKVQAQLAQYAHTLHNGDPCPLCGALEHPSIIKIEDGSHASIAIQTAIDEQNTIINQLRKQLSEVGKIMVTIDSIAKAKEVLDSEMMAVKASLAIHLSTFIWEDFDAMDPKGFAKKKQELMEIEKEIEQKEQALDILNKDSQKELDQLDKANIRLNELNGIFEKNEVQIQLNVSHLQLLKLEDVADKTGAELNESLQQLKQKNDQLVVDYDRNTSSLNTLNPKIAAQKSKIEGIVSRISELEKELNTINATLTDLLLVHEMYDLAEVNTVLAQNLNLTGLRNELHDFKVQYESLQIGVQELEEKLKGKTFETEHFAAHEQLVSKHQEAYKVAANNLAQAHANLVREEVDLAKKKELTASLAKVQLRADNIYVMSRLFHGAGFVNYVSSIYLRQLCDMANVRFHRMTRNQLSLQLSDKNDFEIIDNLNEGKRRSVKTLSGGQGFQVSLSLALALAESVQANAKASKNFFFIDEGFGTQDAASVNIVFETLMNLQKENRIVGIISHVEELKEKIPLSLMITKDETKGSLIKKSW